MPLLALDTSAAVALAVTDDAGAPLAARTVAGQHRHAELLGPLLLAVLADADLRPSDLNAVVVGTGPAPFTGLRAGLVTARTFAFARRIPVWGVASLDALAAQAFDAGVTADVVVVTDARRREVYTARYSVGTHGLPVVEAAPAVSVPSDVELPPDVVVVGRGARLYPEAFPGARDPLDPDAAVLARLAATRAARGEALPAEPLYLRRPDAVPAAGRKRVT